MDKLEATFRVVTPMFLGGADQNNAELREPSIKAALRFWYRAIDPEYKKNEARIFGGSGDEQGQSMFLLRIRKRVNGKPWNRENYNCFDTTHPGYSRQQPHSSTDYRTWQLNGVRYLGFSLFMGDNKNRQAIPAGREFTLELVFKQRPDEQDRRRILAALWLLGHFGSLGTRSRRGFGVLTLISLIVEIGDQWPELDDLSYSRNAGNPQEWLKIYETTLKKIKDWLSGTRVADHTVFSDNTKICLSNTERMEGCKNRQEWEYALDTAGKFMQTFRQRWDLTNPGSDYFIVKQHICANDYEAASLATGLTPSELSMAPERTSFGLPLQFKYSSLKYKKTNHERKRYWHTPGFLLEGGSKERQRSTSRIMIRIAEIGDKAYPVFVRMDGLLLQPGDKIKGIKGRYYDPPNDDILNDFWSSISKVQEMEWGNL